MRLLIISREGKDLAEATKIASNQGAKVSHFLTPQLALEALREGKGADLIFIEITFDIKAFVDQLALEHISLPLIACGFSEDITGAVNAIRAGAKEYLPLPPNEKLIAAILTSISNDKKEVIATSESMKQLLELASRVAGSDANILITGASGTGKEVISSFIHQNSKRASKSFIRLNCAAIPDNLLESELFGHEKGAFTGAVARRIGKFEEAHQGTLLLDEISEMDIRLQAKLLRAIQEKEIDRIGGNIPIKVDIRIIATSNRDLEQEIRKGTFREDLYYRLNIINIEIPKLKDRTGDIAEFAKYFVRKYSKNNNLPVKNLSKATIKLMLEYPWPGNVRELENVMHRAVLVSVTEEIIPQDLKLNINKTYTSEKQYLTNTVKHCLGDYNSAANILGISVQILQEKIQEYMLNEN